MPKRMADNNYNREIPGLVARFEEISTHILGQAC